MKLIKPNNSDYWHVEVTCADGTKRLVNLSHKHKDAARKAMLDAHLPDIQEAAKRNQLTAEVVSLITANRRITVDEAIAEWSAWSKIGVRSEKTAYNTLLSISQWADQMSLGDRTLASIETQDIDGWVNSPRSDKKRGTRMLDLACVRQFFRYCMAKQYILADPSRLVRVDFRLMTHEQRETKHKRVLDDAQVEYLLARSVGAEPPSITPGFFHYSLVMGRDLGMRLADWCGLGRQNFDFKKNTVSCWMEKTNRRVELPITPRVKGEIASLKSDPDNLYFFPNELKIVMDHQKRAVLSTYFSRFFKRCGFDGFSIHSLRATYATDMAINGATLDEIAIALGHRHTTTTRAYVRKQEGVQHAK